MTNSITAFIELVRVGAHFSSMSGCFLHLPRVYFSHNERPYAVKKSDHRSDLVRSARTHNVLLCRIPNAPVFFWISVFFPRNFPKFIVDSLISDTCPVAITPERRLKSRPMRSAAPKISPIIESPFRPMQNELYRGGPALANIIIEIKPAVDSLRYEFRYVPGQAGSGAATPARSARFPSSPRAE